MRVQLSVGVGVLGGCACAGVDGAPPAWRWRWPSGARVLLTVVELVVIACPGGAFLGPLLVIPAPRRPVGAVVAMMAVYAGLFGYLSVQRQRAFWTGRFDVGNMVQAVWSTAHGRPLETTDTVGPAVHAARGAR